MAIPPSGRQRGVPFAALQHRDYRLYWSGILVSGAGTQMQLAAVAWQIYVLTHSALALGLIGLVRIIPIVAFSLIGGVAADAINRRRLLLVTQTFLLLVSSTLAITTVTGTVTLWLIYVLSGLAAGAFAFDNPARQAVVPSLVPTERLANALSLSNIALQVATVLGPSLAGLVIAVRGVGTVYVIDALSFVSVLLALKLISPPPVVGAAQRVSFSAMLEGLHFVRGMPIILSTMLLDFLATFFGSATALLPIFAHDVLRVGAQGYGILYAAPSVGAIVAALAMSVYGGGVRRKGVAILSAICVYALCTVLFGLSRFLPLSLLALAGTGAADTVSAIFRQTVRQMVTPDALRGRMTSINMIFYIGGPQLGEFEAGVVARAFGAPTSVISGGAAALLGALLVAYLAVGLRRYDG